MLAIEISYNVKTVEIHTSAKWQRRFLTTILIENTKPTELELILFVSLIEEQIIRSKLQKLLKLRIFVFLQKYQVITFG